MDTPNTVNYMVGGYAVIFIMLAGYVASLVWRMRGLKNILKGKLNNDNAPGESRAGKES